MRLWVPRALLATLAVVILCEVFVIAPRLDAGLLVVAAVWMAIAGVAFVRQAFAAREPSGIGAWLLGPAVGFGLSVFGVLLWWAVGLQNWWAIVLGPALTWFLAWLARHHGGPTLRLPTFDRRDLIAVSIALLVVPSVTWAPYAHVREPTSDGEAYRAYFTADFVWAMTVTAELAKGEVPPANPFLLGEPLHYYWMSHLLSGALYRNVSHRGITAEQVVLIDGLALGLAFVAFFYALARIAGANPWFAALGVSVGFLANSYEGVNRLWLLHQEGAPLANVKDYNIDAVTRWFYDGMPVDGLQRLLLYQPHHLTGYVMALAALWLVGFAEDVTETSIALWVGILLGLAFVFSTFAAILVGAAIGLLYAVRLLSRRVLRGVWQCAVLAGGPALFGVILTRVLGYTDPSAGLMMMFGLNPVAAKHWPLMWLLSFGPSLLLGIAGLLRVSWVKRDGAASAMLVLVCDGFYFFVDVPDMDGVWVGWRSGHQLLIAFSIIGAAALTAAWRVPRLRLPLVIAVLVLAVPAVPTVAIDVFNAQDVTNRNQGPAFPWTLVITPDEREALNWLKSATPPTAIVAIRTCRARCWMVLLHHRVCGAADGCRVTERDDPVPQISGRDRRYPNRHFHGAECTRCARDGGLRGDRLSVHRRQGTAQVPARGARYGESPGPVFTGIRQRRRRRVCRAALINDPSTASVVSAERHRLAARPRAARLAPCSTRSAGGWLEKALPPCAHIQPRWDASRRVR